MSSRYTKDRNFKDPQLSLEKIDMAKSEDRDVVDLMEVLLSNPVVTIALPSGPTSDIEQRLIGKLVEDSVTRARCMTTLRPILDNMKFEYEVAMRSAGDSGNA